jgi:hypothetical protein
MAALTALILSVSGIAALAYVGTYLQRIWRERS